MVKDNLYSTELTDIGAYGLRYCYVRGFDQDFYEIWMSGGRDIRRGGPLDVVFLDAHAPERVAKRVLWGTVYGWERWLENNPQVLRGGR